ncbi:MAG: hypothetical protein IPK72_13340 [Candidatus Eisenbacteria bacterium]|nr:hypothetical protein [Candidatus Eisenbacteria bacterium]
MGNYLKMMKRQQVIALLELGWTYRRIESETGVRRETISRYARLRLSNAAKVFAGSEGSELARDPVEPDLDGSNPAKVFPGSGGIWQDLVEEYGYEYSYESIKRYVRALDRPVRAVGVYHSEPGEEGQIDFFQGAPTFRATTGQWQRPWVFRLTLCHSRHGYKEGLGSDPAGVPPPARERLPGLGRVPRVIRHDNLKAAVVRACLYDPDASEVYTAFARHWGFTPLPIRPRTPRENGRRSEVAAT